MHLARYLEGLAEKCCPGAYSVRPRKERVRFTPREA